MNILWSVRISQISIKYWILQRWRVLFMLDERGSGQGSRPKKLSVFTKFEVSREQVGGSIGEVERWEVVGGKWGTGWQGLEIDHHLCPTHWHLNLPWDIPLSLEMSELDRNCCLSAKWYHWSATKWLFWGKACVSHRSYFKTGKY